MRIEPDLLQTILNLTDVDELQLLLEDLLTPAELDDLNLRWKLVKDLHQGVTQRKISDKYGISLCKITRGSKILKNPDSMVLRLLNRAQKNKQSHE